MYDSDNRTRRTEEHRLLVQSDSQPSLKTIVIFLVVLLASVMVFMNLSERVASERRDSDAKRQQTAAQQMQDETSRRQDAIERRQEAVARQQAVEQAQQQSAPSRPQR